MPTTAIAPEDLHDRIATRAYEIWEERGRPEGASADDWQEAEAQILAEVEQSAVRSPFFRVLVRFGKRATAKT